MQSAVFSALQLNRYVLRSLSLETADTDAVDGSNEGELGLDYGAFYDSAQPGHYKFELMVAVNPSDEAFGLRGLRVAATITGYFTLEGSAADGLEGPDAGVVHNGLAILYGTLRPILTGLAMQAGRPDFALPTVDMGAFVAEHALGSESE